jgi:hypothetical protein
MSRTKQNARIMSIVGAEIDAYMRRPCSRAPADGLTPMQRINNNPEFRAAAARQWDAIPTDLADIAVWMRGDPITPFTMEGGATEGVSEEAPPSEQFDPVEEGA